LGVVARQPGKKREPGREQWPSTRSAKRRLRTEDGSSDSYLFSLMMKAIIMLENRLELLKETFWGLLDIFQMRQYKVDKSGQQRDVSDHPFFGSLSPRSPIKIAVALSCGCSDAIVDTATLTILCVRNLKGRFQWKFRTHRQRPKYSPNRRPPLSFEGC
jgi:hypothetical protein